MRYRPPCADPKTGLEIGDYLSFCLRDGEGEKGTVVKWAREEDITEWRKPKEEEWLIDFS